jgi:TRAP-type uncharacterized transport system substrate-binding protein
MQRHIDRVRQIVVPKLHGNQILVGLAILAAAVAAGLWLWNTESQVHRLRIGAGVELKYRKDLVSILCEEARQYELAIDVAAGHSRSADAMEQVSRGELDVAVVPAGMAMQLDNIRQVAVLDCEPLQLFVRPEMLSGGVGALKGKRLNLGSVGSGSRVIAGEVLQFIGMKPGADYQDEAYAYPELIKFSAEQMPDAVFSLAPLPAPLGERLVQQYGYHLMELPFGAALNLRKPAIEDVVIPAHTYGARPAVPDRPLHTVGTRPVVIANAHVPKVSIRRLLEVIYQSDFSRRVGLPPMDENLIHRSAEFPNHAGTVAYLHRHDPWVNKEFVDNVMSLRGLGVSVVSAVLLLWQWLRRRTSSGLNDYLRMCTKLEIDAARAALEGRFNDEQLATYLRQLSELKVDALERHLSGTFPGDQQFGLLLSRVESLQKSLPGLLPRQPLEVVRKAA